MMLKIVLSFAALIGTGQINAQNLQPFAFSDIAVMSLNENGKYAVVCSNGNREVVTDLDLQLGNVCPNQTSSKPSNILSLQKRADGLFDVVCRDFRKIVASEEDLLKKDVCKKNLAEQVILPGEYKVESGYTSFYNQQITPEYDGKKLIRFLISVKSGWKAALDCTELTCTGFGSNSSAVTVLVVDSNHYDFENGGSKARFVWIKE